MKIKVKYINWMVVAVFFTSCAPIYYPNRLNAPMIKEKGAFNVEGSVGFTGFDLQGAYSPKENIGLMANFSTIGGSSSHNHTFFEAGAGYYNSLGTKGLFEVYGGGGYGQAKGSTFDFPESTLSGSYYRLFIQPSIGLVHEWSNVYFATRLVYVDFGGAKNSPFIEPFIGNRIGWENIKINSQIGVSYRMSGAYIDYMPIIINIGVSYTFNKKTNKN